MMMAPLVGRRRKTLYFTIEKKTNSFLQCQRKLFYTLLLITSFLVLMVFIFTPFHRSKRVNTMVFLSLDQIISNNFSHIFFYSYGKLMVAFALLIIRM